MKRKESIKMTAIMKHVFDTGKLKRLVAGLTAFLVTISPLQTTISTFADELNNVSETQSEETQSEVKPTPVETEIVSQATAETETTAKDPEEYQEQDYSDFAVPSESSEASATEETSEQTSEGTLPETTESEEIKETSETTLASETKVSAETEESTVSVPDETQISESVEETEPQSEDAVEEKKTNISVANSSEDYFKLVAALPEGYKRIVVDTYADLTAIEVEAGVYYDGTYILVFGNADTYAAGVQTISASGYEYLVDGTLSACSGFDNLVNNGSLNPSATIKVAVIDTGSNLANEKYSVIGNDASDHNGHGTAMCNYILDETNNAYIISIKALGDNAQGNMSDVYAAVQLAENFGVDYILLAMNIRNNGKYDAFKSLIEGTKAKVVASAGNNGTDAVKYIPAGISGVITVGAVGDNAEIKSFSNYGTCVEYYIYKADSTSEAAARALGRLIDGRKDDIAVDAWLSENRWYYEGSEYYLEANNTVDGRTYNGTLNESTKTITVLNAQDINIDARTGMDVYDSFYYYSRDYGRWAVGKSMPGGCIRLAIGAYIYGATKNCPYDQVGNHTFRASTGFRFDFTGTNSFMSSGGYSSADGIGLTGLKASAPEAAGNDFYKYVTKYAEPGDMIMFGYPGSSNAWRHVVIYDHAVSASDAPDETQYYYGGVKRNSIVVYEASESFPYGTRRVINAQDFTVTSGNKAATSAVILKIAAPKPIDVTVKKTSTNTAIVTGNACYSIVGTTYGLYKGDGTLIHTYTLDANGETTAYTVQPEDGTTLYIQEITAGPGYELDTTKHTVNLNSAVNDLVTINVQDIPIADPISWTVKKVDPYNWSLATDKTLAGAVFRIDYYDRTDIKTESDLTLINSDTPKATANLTSTQVSTNKYGEITININTLASADASGYFNGFVSSLQALPLGTYTITEVSAPNGYSVADPSKPLVFCIYDNNGIPEAIHIGSSTIYHKASDTEIIMDEQPHTGKLISDKVVSDPAAVIIGLHNLNGTKYGIYYKDNDKLVCTITYNDAGKMSDVVYAAGITPETPFNPSSPSLALELPVGDYYAKEISAGRWYLIDSSSHYFSITAGNTTTISFSDAVVPPPKIHTTALDADTGTHILSYKERVTINDKVDYEGLVPGEEYTATGTLYNAETGEVYKDSEGKTYTESVKFTPTSSNSTIAANGTASGSINVTFSNVLVPYSKVRIVVCEDLYENQNNIKLASHADLTDENQTVERRVPEVQTTACDIDNGTSTLTYKERVSIRDKATYTNLNPGEKYYFVGTLIDVATGQEYTDAEGNIYTKVVEFTAAASEGEEIIEFKDVLVPYTKTTIVCFEELYEEGTDMCIAMHADLTDKNQTLYRPYAGTTATVNNAKAVWLGTTEVQNITIADTISYEGLTAGTLYRSEATLYLIRDGAATQLTVNGAPIVSLVEFTPTDTNGSVVVNITFSTEGLAEGDQIVVFEKIFDVATEAEIQSGTQTEDLLIAKHEDQNDKGQTITVHFRPMTGGIVPSYSVVGAMLAIIASALAGAWFVMSRKKRYGEA